MDHRDSLNHLRGKRSFGIKLARKPHKPWPEVLSTLRVLYSNVDINEVNLAKVNLYGNKKNPVRPQKKKLEPTQNPFDEKVEQLRKEIEKSELDNEDKELVECLRRGRVVFGPDTGNLDIDILMPNLMSVTLTVNGAKKLEEIKPEAILQAKRYPDQEQLSENTRYVFWFYDRKGRKQEIYDETRSLGSLDLMVPVLFLREPDGHEVETKINDQITSAVGISLTTIETSLDNECAKFRSLLFDSIQEAEKKREYEGLDHYAFPEETVLKGFGSAMRPANSLEMFESDLDEMQYNENLEESEERAMERLKRKIDASVGVAQVWYRPNETDDYTFFAQIGRDVIERTPIEVIEMALDYLKGREGVEIKEPPEAFILQVAGKQSFITRYIPLKRYEYIRSCFENYKTPVLILRLKSAIFPNYVKPPPIFVPAFIQAERNIKSERNAIENEKQRNRAKMAENKTRKLQMKLGKRSTMLDEYDEEVPKSEPINFWDLDDELKIRIHSASHLIITGIEKLYVKVAVTVGTNVLSQRDSPIVSPSNPRWGNCLLDFGLYLKDIPKSAQLCLSLISEKTKKKGSEATPLGFSNIRLFDWEDYLLQGKKTVFFWPFPKDFNGLLNPTGVIGSNHDQTVARLEIELTDFGNRVKYPPFDSILQFLKIMQQRKARGTGTSDSLPEIENFDENSENIKRLTTLRKIMDPKNLKIDDQRFLWQARKKISTNFPSMLPIIVDIPMIWKTRETFCELYGMLVDWPLLQVDAAMEMLDGKCTDTWIRDAAVDRIDRALDNDQLQLYLLPLVQALRYEPFANSGLAKMLVKRGLLNYKIGHTLFWLLRAELNYFDLSPSVVKVPKFYTRFAICLEMYLRGNSVHLPGIVKQVDLVNILTSLSLMVKNVGAKESATKKLQQELLQKKEDLQNMISPLNPTDRLGELLIDKCSVLGSAKQPLKLTWKNPEPLARLTAETHQIIFKNGDDLRQDMLTLQVMRIMDAKWKIHNLDYCLTLYEVLPMGRNIGMIHVVQNCQTLFQIQISANQIGSALNMDNSLFNKYLYQCSSDSKQYMECVDRFTSSLAGYCIVTYILGIKDRHQDNIMLAKDGRIFHIDFGHFLGHTKMKFGINRERTEFILTEHFLHIVSRGKSNLKDTYEYKSFRESCVRGFLVLYHNARFFIVLFRMMLCMGLPELSTQNHIDFITQSFMYDKTTEEAKTAFLNIFDGVVKSDWSTSVNWFFHAVKHL